MVAQLDLDLSGAQKERLFQLNGLDEFRMQALLLMRAMGFDCSALINRCPVFSLANILFISTALDSSWFIHDAKAINCRYPILALESQTFMSMREM